MKVPFVDLAELHQPIAGELETVFHRVLNKSSFVLGPEVQTFEAEFASYLNVAHCVAVTNGTVALQLTLQAMGIGPGDEVITVSNTFIATAEAISAVGATPVFVDIDPVSYNMDPAKVVQAITAKTKALMPVHLYGQAADLDPLLEIAEHYQLALIEDTCQSHGAVYKGKMAGTIGTAGCFSFYPGKNLGALGEGGAIVTNDAELAGKMRLLRDHGSIRKYEHLVPGYNYRMEGLQGGFLSVKLKHLDAWNAGRREAAAKYQQLLAGAPLILPAEMSYGKHVYHLYVVQVEEREAVRAHLSAAGVETGLHYPTPLHLQQAYAELGYKMGDLPVTEAMTGRLLSLPMYPTLTEEKVERVATVLLEALECSAIKQQGAAA